MKQHTLSGGVRLVEDHEACDHYIIVPMDDLMPDIRLVELDAELAQRGLEIMDDAECAWEFVASGMKISLAEVNGD